MLMVNTEEDFSTRLEQAIEMHPRCPEATHGRLTWLRDLLAKEAGLEVSLNTVHKWASGQARPRPDKVKAIAQVLSVDEVWLSVGSKPVDTPRTRRHEARRASGAVMTVAGLVEMSGGHIAFPDSGDKTASENNVHLYATMDGALRRLTVIAGKPEDDDRVVFNVPWPVAGNRVLGLIVMPSDKFGCVSIYDLTDTGGQAMGGYRSIVASRSGAKLMVGGEPLPQIASMDDLA